MTDVVKIRLVAVVRFFLVLALLTAIGAAGAYYASSYFLPSVYSTTGKIDIEILKVLPAAIAAVVASVIAATTAVINVGLQLQSAKKLETHRIAEQLKANKELADNAQKFTGELADNAQKFTGELADNAQKFTGELEHKRNKFALELDKRKQELGQQLTVEKMEIERRLGRVTQAEGTAESFRYAVCRIRYGDYQQDEISGLSRGMAEIANGLNRDEALYKAWRWFGQRGLYLSERASKFSTSRRRRLWLEQDEKTGKAYGPEFVDRARKVRALLEAEREEIYKQALTSKG